ncbi:hypothetical protein [Couchioplanes caeruleus]|uniref:Uncharacterized protein n=1 Tax=Couchioplanes caeruleus TaxID=56438 RepID=A0A3N1GIT6_9ACTN|nr:hypothetical protein [Couchioplanes caeruleus]ROP30108.1 hypothetical protein EDD30_2941 [Couchioplanes caeruleus]
MSLLSRWRKACARRAFEATRRAQRAEEVERAAARRRLSELAATVPDWNTETRYLPTAPLLTPGQRDCGRSPQRRTYGGTLSRNW